MHRHDISDKHAIPEKYSSYLLIYSEKEKDFLQYSDKILFLKTCFSDISYFNMY